MLTTLVSRLKTLNFYSTPSTANNEYELRNEQISTRIFLILSVLSSLIITIYTAQVSITRTIDVKEPSFEQFQLLFFQYSGTLHCPCDNIAIPHWTFIDLKPRFHQLCTSDFIEQDWIDHLRSAADEYVSSDFSYTGAYIFQTLASFCYSANETISNALQTFMSTRFITAEVVAEKFLKEDVNAIIHNFQLSTEFIPYLMVNLIHLVSQTNQLVSGLFSNAILRLDEQWGFGFFYLRSFNNDTCLCESLNSCVDVLTLQDRRGIESMFAIPGLYQGCFLSQGVLQSSMECFYQNACISAIEAFLQAPLSLSTPISPLNSSAKSRFNMSSTVDQLLSKAMTEEWISNISYVQYFDQCHASSCTYLITSKLNLIYIITTLIGMIGGITKILFTLVHPIVKFIRRRLVPPPTPMTDVPQTKPSLWQRLRAVNFFSKPSGTSNAEETKQQIIGTRLFCLLLIISFIVLITYYSAVPVSIFHQINSPTFEQYLHVQAEQHSNPSFSCLCSTLAVPYEKFLQVHYIPHPLCFSHILQILSSGVVEGLDTFPFDFRYLARPFFLSFDALCQVSMEHINNRLISFNSSLFIADQVPTPEIFHTNMKEISSTTKLSIVSSLVNPLAVIFSMIDNNKLMSAALTNFLFDFRLGESGFETFVLSIAFRHDASPESIYCNCLSYAHCYRSMSIFDLSVDVYHLTSIPGLYSGCSIMEGMNVSNLACLFDQSCLNMMITWLNTTNANIINPNELVSFTTNSTIEQIMNEVFIDQWNFSASYRAFYEQCQPSSCVYTLIQRNSLIIIFTAVFSLLGGLIKILKLTVPRFIQGIFFLYNRCCRPRTERTTNPTNGRSKFSLQSIWNILRHLNFFPSRNPMADNEYKIRNQIIATRVFLIVSALSVIILAIYSSQQSIMKKVTFNNPTIDKYTSLITSKSGTLTCPCKNITIRRGDFLTFQPNFHQICQSNFTNPDWSLKLGRILSYNPQTPPSDFRRFGPVMFQAITAFCQLSQTRIENGLQNFYRSRFVTNEVVSYELLMQQGQSLINLFISISENEFINALQINRDMTFTNLLISGIGSSIEIKLHVVNETVKQFKVRAGVLDDPLSSSNCTCNVNPSCVKQATVFDRLPNDTIPYIIPGFYIGCQVVEAILQSNFHILYNQSWIDEYRAKIGFDSVNPDRFSTIALNASLRSRYNMTTPIRMIIENMMIEDWHSLINYSAYYGQCHPVECEHTYVVKFDIIYIITTTIGLIGGLLTIFQFLIPLLVKLIRRYCFKRRRQTTIQVISTSTVSKHA